MYFQDVIGELLYIGIVAEKGRCYGVRWKYGYKEILKRHIFALNELQKCLQSADDKIAYAEINNFLKVCDSISEIGKFYNFSYKQVEGLRNGKEYCKVNRLINRLFVDLEKEIRRPYIRKRRVYDILCALHNLPRVYLGKNKKTLCNLEYDAISEQDAIEYALSNMNSKMKKEYISLD